VYTHLDFELKPAQKFLPGCDSPYMWKQAVTLGVYAGVCWMHD